MPILDGSCVAPVLAEVGLALYVGLGGGDADESDDEEKLS